MPRTQRDTAEWSMLRAHLVTTGENAPTVDQKIQLLESIRAQSAEKSRQTDRFIIEQLSALRANLAEAVHTQQALKEIHERLTAPPYHPAIFLGFGEVGAAHSAMVMYGNSRRVVTCSDELDPETLAPGEEVLLSNEMNLIVARSPYSVLQCGQTGFFDRYTPDGRIVLKDRDEEIVVNVGGNLKDQILKAGDQLRWERNAWMALQKIERARGDSLFIEETPIETFENIGGLDRQIEELQRPIRLHYFNSEIARRYGLRRVGSLLLWGPPGNGKTTMVRALSNWMAKLSKSGRSRFVHIKPLEFGSMWYSESERNIRNIFRMAREAGNEQPEVPVVMFFDEVDSIGTSRGTTLMRVDDKVLTALMAELDGLESRGNILVVAATNRRDILDPALTRQGRLGDVQIEIPRPNMKAACEIFAKHLSPSIPYAATGRDTAEARQHIIQSAVSRIYSPNGDSELMQIGFRDGKRRIVKACDLMSGASIANIARATIERACVREAEGGEPGLRLEDVLHTLADEFECLSRSLNPTNCRQHLLDLPQDVDVVRVEPVKKKVPRTHHYINAA
jgi:proteasome-associated ATPase